jgi:hypothetical protein
MAYTPTPRVKNALDDTKMKLTAPAPTAAGKTASLVWGITGNNPRATVYTQDPNENDERTGYGKIIAKLDITVFNAFMVLVRQIANGPTDTKAKMENKNYTWFNRKRSDTPAVINTLWAGKDKDGGVWISIDEQNRPKIKFYISTPDFHCLYNGDGTPFTPEQVSKTFTIGYTELVQRTMNNLFTTTWVAPEPKTPPQNNGGGYNQQQQRQAPQQSRQAAPPAESTSDDDFPY